MAVLAGCIGLYYVRLLVPATNIVSRSSRMTSGLTSAVGRSISRYSCFVTD